MKIPGRIKALIVMAVVIYVLAHVMRAMVMMLMRSTPLLPASSKGNRRVSRLSQDSLSRNSLSRDSLARDSDETLKHCTRC